MKTTNKKTEKSRDTENSSEFKDTEKSSAWKLILSQRKDGLV